MKPRLLIILIIIAFVISSAFIAYSLLESLSSQYAKTSVKHFCVKVSGFWAVGFTLESSEDGFYSYAVYCNYSKVPLSYSDEGYIKAGSSFTYTVNVIPEPNAIIVVNIKVWWNGQLIDEVNHHIRAED